mgnify:CR=1 FL=1
MRQGSNPNRKFMRANAPSSLNGKEDGNMADIAFITLGLSIFALLCLYVRACERL